MLDRAHRLTQGDDFAATLRRGRRAGTTTLVLHLAIGTVAEQPRPVPPRVGLVVGKVVGNAVTRSRVKRRLRHLARARLGALPDGSRVVVRALPPAASAPSSQLARDLDQAMSRVLRREERR